MTSDTGFNQKALGCSLGLTLSDITEYARTAGNQVARTTEQRKASFWAELPIARTRTGLNHEARARGADDLQWNK